jgi:hypothetical protein
LTSVLFLLPRQVGDILDRGDHELSILRMFRRLAKQAAKDGGAVYLVNGNHEIMNVAGDFRYVTPGAFQNVRRRGGSILIQGLFLY